MLWYPIYGAYGKFNNWWTGNAKGEILESVFKLLGKYKMFAAIQCNTLNVAVPYLWRQRQVQQMEQGTPKGNWDKPEKASNLAQTTVPEWSSQIHTLNDSFQHCQSLQLHNCTSVPKDAMIQITDSTASSHKASQQWHHWLSNISCWVASKLAHAAEHVLLRSQCWMLAHQYPMRKVLQPTCDEQWYSSLAPKFDTTARWVW